METSRLSIAELFFLVQCTEFNVFFSSTTMRIMQQIEDWKGIMMCSMCLCVQLCFLFPPCDLNAKYLSTVGYSMGVYGEEWVIIIGAFA